MNYKIGEIYINKNSIIDEYSDVTHFCILKVNAQRGDNIDCTVIMQGSRSSYNGEDEFDYDFGGDVTKYVRSKEMFSLSKVNKKAVLNFVFQEEDALL